MRAGDGAGWLTAATSRCKHHGRLEQRQCWVITDPRELDYVGPHRKWTNLSAAARVSYRRDAAASSPADIRYYICSYPADTATLLAATKSRCSIENGLHWVLDVALTRIAAD